MTGEYFRVVQISDPHLGVGRLHHQRNWELVLEWLETERPDLVVITGDAIYSDPDNDADMDYARRQLERIPVAWNIIAGNHDLGDSMINPLSEARINHRRRERWRAAFGCEFWVERHGAWALVGINAQLLNASSHEDEQAAFLRSSLAALPSGMPVALFTHKALFADHPSETTVSTDVLDPVARASLQEILNGCALRLVASGHNHQYRSFGLGDVLHVWSPSVAGVTKKPDVRHWGIREVGFIDYRLFSGGEVRLRVVGQDFLVRNESYIQKLEDASSAQAAAGAHKRYPERQAVER
jgi:3',5'-cyclic AMP phosphodiesterase CpdA